MTPFLKNDSIKNSIANSLSCIFLCFGKFGIFVFCEKLPLNIKPLCNFEVTNFRDQSLTHVNGLHLPDIS